MYVFKYIQILRKAKPKNSYKKYIIKHIFKYYHLDLLADLF